MLLPPLRADLQLSAAAPALDGSPQWTLADSLRGRYFKLGAAAMRLLRHWQLSDAEQVLQAANREPGIPLEQTDVEELLRFLRGNDLITATDAEQRESYTAKAAQQRQGLWQSLLHQYLFFRIPLWRPDAFLDRTWPWLRRHGPRLLKFGLPLLLCLGVFLVARDWERFITTFPHLFSLGGALSFAIALTFAKLCHEFGHAYMAKRAGCRVQSMGLAFMVMLPMFYTDVSDAWRVNDRRSRLLIGAGGIMAELILACIALLAWSLMPDGPARTAAFMLASATWITTLVINLNPFMRFDGYFLLSDLWGVDNLQNRGFALCRWHLRETLFGYGEPAPEPWSASMQRKLLLWGYGSWLWRAALFLAIALVVYHMFFKLLGIFLMLVELAWFIGLPIWREMKEWWQRREQAHLSKSLLTGAILLLLLGFVLVPWRSSVEIPAMLEASGNHALHSPLAARLKYLHVQDGQQVEKGALLLELESPDLNSRLTIVRHEIEIVQLQLRRQAGRSETISDIGVLEQQLAEAVAEYRGLAAQRLRLEVRAPSAGTVRDLIPGLIPGRWLSPQEPLVRVIEPGLRLRGYLAEEQLWRVASGAEGLFVSENPLSASLSVRLQEIDATGVTSLQIEALSSDHHGPIAVRRNSQQEAEPIQGQYGVRLSLQEDLPLPRQPIRGTVILPGKNQSVLSLIWRRIAALGVRESGF